MEEKEKKLRLVEVNLENGMKVTMDINSRSKCKKCKKEIFWAVTKNEKMMPVELVGLAKWDTHYATCPYANEFRKKKNEKRNN